MPYTSSSIFRKLVTSRITCGTKAGATNNGRCERLGQPSEVWLPSTRLYQQQQTDCGYSCNRVRAATGGTAVPGTAGKGKAPGTTAGSCKLDMPVTTNAVTNDERTASCKTPHLFHHDPHSTPFPAFTAPHVL
jgi:hypothetical protein